jgi:CBS domain-containing protein
MKVAELAERISGDQAPWNRARLFPIVTPCGELEGIISRADVLAAIAADPETTVLQAGVGRPHTIHPQATLAEAADRMVLHGIGRLPVVDHSGPPRLCGLISRREILQARRHRIEDERRG